MTSRPYDELISAYLDGELTADEQARVEQLLAENAAARQLLDEMRALRVSFEALPRLQLPADFSRQVLRRAERAMLTSSPGVAGAPGGTNPTEVGLPRLLAPPVVAMPANAARENHGTDNHVTENHVTVLPRGESAPWYVPRTFRAVFWPAAVLAAALVMMLYTPPRSKPRPVAQAPTGPAPEASMGAAPAGQPETRSLAKQVAKSDGEFGETIRATEMRHVDKARSERDGLGPAQESPAADRLAEREKGTELQKGAELQLPAPASPPGSVAPLAGSAPANGVAADLAPSEKTQSNSVQEQAGELAGKGQSRALSRMAADAKGAAADNDLAESENADALDALPLEVAPSLKSAQRGVQSLRTDGNAVPWAADKDTGADKESRADEETSPTALFVDCQITAEAARSNAFGQLLAKHQLAAVEPSLQDEAHAADAEPDSSRVEDARSGGAAADAPVPAPAPPAGLAGGAAAKKLEALNVQQNAATAQVNQLFDPAEPTVVIVDGSAAQVAAALAELHEHPEQFPLVKALSPSEADEAVEKAASDGPVVDEESSKRSANDLQPRRAGVPHGAAARNRAKDGAYRKNKGRKSNLPNEPTRDSAVNGALAAPGKQAGPGEGAIILRGTQQAAKPNANLRLEAASKGGVGKSGGGAGKAGGDGVRLGFGSQAGQLERAPSQSGQSERPVPGSVSAGSVPASDIPADQAAGKSAYRIDNREGEERVQVIFRLRVAPATAPAASAGRKAGP